MVSEAFQISLEASFVAKEVPDRIRIGLLKVPSYFWCLVIFGATSNIDAVGRGRAEQYVSI